MTDVNAAPMVKTVYDKIGVATRAGATLFAVEQALPE